MLGYAMQTANCPVLPCRLPSEHPTLIKWSAPAFLRIRLASVGLSLGHQTLHSFTACMSSATREWGWGSMC